MKKISEEENRLKLEKILKNLKGGETTDEQAKTFKCSKCGNKADLFNNGDRFCSKCGNPFYLPTEKMKKTPINKITGSLLLKATNSLYNYVPLIPENSQGAINLYRDFHWNIDAYTMMLAATDKKAANYIEKNQKEAILHASGWRVGYALRVVEEKYIGKKSSKMKLEKIEAALENTILETIKAESGEDGGEKFVFSNETRDTLLKDESKKLLVITFTLTISNSNVSKECALWEDYILLDKKLINETLVALISHHSNWLFSEISLLQGKNLTTEEKEKIFIKSNDNIVSGYSLRIAETII